jgi:type IV pilus assembly protein PilY1
MTNALKSLRPDRPLRTSASRRGRWKALAAALLATGPACAALSIADLPLFVTTGAPPLVLINLGRDHRLYYEAYNDAADLNGDGELDVGYRPDQIDYYGYFDSHKCYTYGSARFEPTSTTADKRCAGASEWSGDFLSYLTMSRMDALRKVLYGGYRSTDGTTETVLERVYIPQDAHSWGKEYTSVAHDGYDIRDYSPLDLPPTGTRHLFANTTLLCPSGNTDPGCAANLGAPLLRTLTNSRYRVWEWVSIERPVAGVQCATGNNVRATCASAGGTYWEVVPASYFSGLTQTTYDTSGHGTHPSSHAAYDTLVSTYGTLSRRLGSGAAGNVQGSGNPFGADDSYLTIFEGSLVIPAGEDGSYTFAVDGDDAVEVIIDGAVVSSWYGGHGNCNPVSCTATARTVGTVALSAGSHTLVFRHEELTGGDNYALYWQRTVPASTLTDRVVRVKVCDPAVGLEANCRAYGTGGSLVYKPTGLLHEYGEDGSTMFGLMTGSYTRNTSGGVLRKNVQSFADEVNPDTGQLTAVAGVVRTIDRLRIKDFGGNYSYNAACTVPEVAGPLAEGRCRMWGNPTAEMTYEGLRYFAGKTSPTTAFATGVGGATSDDTVLTLPLATWQDPYRDAASGGFPYCSRPTQLVISDINPNYDTDQVPGHLAGFAASTFSGDLSGLSAATLGDTIWAGEAEASPAFIGQSGTSYDGAPTPKAVTSFGSIRGLAPEGPTQQGGFYSASVALYGKTTDLNPVVSAQKTDTLAVALASPLPRIEIPIAGQWITLVPFAKSVGGNGISASPGAFQPTNTIVDFYVETIRNTGPSNRDTAVNEGRPYGKFRINYEDSEYGSDHDMDAIVEYTLTVNADDSLTVRLDSTYAAGSVIQHMGYVISGTTQDGTYLEVRDTDTSSDVDYFLDTPPGQLPGGVWADGTALPLSAVRTFRPGATGAASYIRHDPLWYAAKWGGFVDANKNNRLDATEWDGDGDGVPDSYFLVTNAALLEQQLGRALATIELRNASASAVATNSTRLDTDTLVYQGSFHTGDWSGSLKAYAVDPADGDLDVDDDGLDDPPVWDAATRIPAHGSRNILTYDPAAQAGIPFAWASLTETQRAALDPANVLEPSSPVLGYLRGDDRNERRNGGTYRDRSVKLGDIVNSDPWYVGTPDFGYDRLPGSEGTSYVTFRAQSAYKARRPMLYVGANDGMLHGFDATDGASGGLEVMAYVPGAVVAGLPALLSPDYSHRYFLDGAPRAGDAYVDTSGSGARAWRTLLVGTTGAGAKAAFVLDVTEPDGIGAADVLWEVSDRAYPAPEDCPDDPSDPDYPGAFANDLGYTLPQASVARMANGEWAVVLGNGYNSTSGKAVLFLLEAGTGRLIKKIDTGVGSPSTPNGLGTPVAVDVDGNRTVDVIYAGDLHGNLWKLDVSASSAGSWGSAFTLAGVPQPLFVARDGSGVAQPITAKPQVGRHPEGGVMVLFGTGKYFETGDNVVGASPQVQTFYGLRDDFGASGLGTPIAGRSDLQAQTILAEGTVGLYNARVTSSTPVDYAVKNGWYLDLVSPGGAAAGERVVSPSLLRSGRVIFTTLIPSSDPCEFGGTSWLMEVDATTGARLDVSPFDFDGDGVITLADLAELLDTNGDGVVDGRDDAVPASGKESEVGITKQPGVISMGEISKKYTSGSSGSLEVTTESEDGVTGRMSWRQLR